MEGPGYDIGFLRPTFGGRLDALALWKRCMRAWVGNFLVGRSGCSGRHALAVGLSLHVRVHSTLELDLSVAFPIF